MENNCRRDVFGKPPPPTTVNKDAFEASTSAPPPPSEKCDRRDVFGCNVHEAPQMPMCSAKPKFLSGPAGFVVWVK